MPSSKQLNSPFFDWCKKSRIKCLITKPQNFIIVIPFFFSNYTKWASYGHLWAKGDHLMVPSYLKENHYPECTPNFHSDQSQYSNPCARGSQDLQSAKGSTVPLKTFSLFYLVTDCLPRLRLYVCTCVCLISTACYKVKFNN